MDVHPSWRTPYVANRPTTPTTAAQRREERRAEEIGEALKEDGEY